MRGEEGKGTRGTEKEGKANNISERERERKRERGRGTDSLG